MHLKRSYDQNHILTIQNDTLTFLFEADQDIYVKSVEGICMLVVSSTLDPQYFSEFVIHRTIKINKGVYFNFIPLGNTSRIEMAFNQDTSIINRFFNGIYTHSRIKPNFKILELVAYYYNIRSTNYFFLEKRISIGKYLC